EPLGLPDGVEEERGHFNPPCSNRLDLSRIEAGTLRPQKSWQDLDTLIDDVVDRLRPVTHHHRLHLDVPGGLPPVWLDPVEIGEVIYNLVDNATKYAPPDTEIRLAMRPEACSLALSVEDQGPGISPAALPHLFESFYRATDSRPKAQGLGLGLAIVK